MDALLVLRLNISPEGLSKWFLQLKNAFLPHTRWEKTIEMHIKLRNGSVVMQ